MQHCHISENKHCETQISLCLATLVERTGGRYKVGVGGLGAMFSKKSPDIKNISHLSTLLWIANCFNAVFPFISVQ